MIIIIRRRIVIVIIIIVLMFCVTASLYSYLIRKVFTKTKAFVLIKLFLWKK